MITFLTLALAAFTNKVLEPYILFMTFIIDIVGIISTYKIVLAVIS